MLRTIFFYAIPFVVLLVIVPLYTRKRLVTVKENFRAYRRHRNRLMKHGRRMTAPYRERLRRHLDRFKRDYL